MSTAIITINAANITHSHIYLKGCVSFFPADTFGGPNAASKASKEIRISWPSGEDVFTDIAGDKNIFRKRGWIGKFFKFRNVMPGDKVRLTWVAPYHLKVDTEKESTMAESNTGQTIQIAIKATWLDRYKFELPGEFKDFFPADALGARGEAEAGLYPPLGKPVEFDYGVTKSQCDVATRKSGAMRPRDNGGMRQFLAANKFAEGDVVSITRTSTRSYKVTLIKR